MTFYLASMLMCSVAMKRVEIDVKVGVRSIVLDDTIGSKTVNSKIIFMYRELTWYDGFKGLGNLVALKLVSKYSNKVGYTIYPSISFIMDVPVIF
jgi:hypothetical protein